MWFIALLLASCDQSDTDRWNGFLNFVEYKNSINSSYEVHATFNNEASFPVDLYKVSKIQKELNPLGLIQASLQPGEKRKLNCEVGDTFTARVNSPGTKYDKLLLLAHDVGRIYISDNLCEQIELISCDRKPFTADKRWTPPDSLIFTNKYSETINLYFYDGVCEEIVGTVHPDMDHHIQSTVGHSFRIRDISGKLLQEHTFKEIPIRGLESDEDYEISERASALFDRVHLKLLHESLDAHKKMISELESYSDPHVECVA